MRKHVIQICVITGISLAVFASINWLIDPYKIWKVPEVLGVNSSRVLVQTHERIYKTVGFARKPANTIILGTSRSDNGLDPAHPALGQNALNMAISGQPYRETRMIFDLMSDRKATNTFVVGLDFFEANNFLGYPPDFVEENFSSFRDLQLLLSNSTLIDSFFVLTDSARSNFNPPPAVSNSKNILPAKHIIEAPRIEGAEKGLHLMSDARDEGGHRSIFRYSEKFFLKVFYLPEPFCSFTLAPINQKLDHMEEIRAIIARSYREHKTLKLFISPSHARQWETLAAAGLWSKWEDWKRLLVRINEEEAKQAGQPAFPLWDFSGYHTISTEAVPSVGDTGTSMHWYYDSSHYTPATGDLVLDRIFSYTSPVRTVPDDFGVLMTSTNISAHLSNIRVARERYRKTYSKDVTEIEELAREVAISRHCKTIPK